MYRECTLFTVKQHYIQPMYKGQQQQQQLEGLVSKVVVLLVHVLEATPLLLVTTPLLLLTKSLLLAKLAHAQEAAWVEVRRARVRAVCLEGVQKRKLPGRWRVVGVVVVVVGQAVLLHAQSAGHGGQEDTVRWSTPLEQGVDEVSSSVGPYTSEVGGTHGLEDGAEDHL